MWPTAEALKAKLVKLPTVSKVIDIQSFVPDDQQAKLAIIADANSILTPTLLPHTPAAPITPDQIRLAAKTALAQIDPALAKLPKDHPLAAIAADLHRMLTAPDDVLLADRPRADAVPAGSARPAAHCAERRAGDAGLDPARRCPRLAAARRPGARAGAVHAAGAQQRRACSSSSPR